MPFFPRNKACRTENNVEIEPFAPTIGRRIDEATSRRLAEEHAKAVKEKKLDEIVEQWDGMVKRIEELEKDNAELKKKVAELEKARP